MTSDQEKRSAKDRGRRRCADSRCRRDGGRPAEIAAGRDDLRPAAPAEARPAMMPRPIRPAPRFAVADAELVAAAAVCRGRAMALLAFVRAGLTPSPNAVTLDSAIGLLQAETAMLREARNPGPSLRTRPRGGRG